MAPRRRPALGALFFVLSLAFAVIAIAAARAGGSAWVIAATAIVLALWLGSLSLASLRGP
ncbi:MAG: hypothetical protein M3M94_00725 [Actinomycetota bacterium]|nr:hypothetical protein [Actinomycetota bacterium]